MKSLTTLVVVLLFILILCLRPVGGHEFNADCAIGSLTHPLFYVQDLLAAITDDVDCSSLIDTHSMLNTC